MDWRKDISVLQGLFDKKRLEPFITHIRFPVYKRINPDARLEFNFPLTVIVGRNGVNKSSVLQALYGSPANYNVGDYWFETATDHIKSKSCFIYGYFAPHSKKEVEVIKTRITRKYKNSEKINPDYWEPSRPILMHGMEKIQKAEGDTPPDRSQTRWNPVEKNVVYLDFRSEISAFDKCLYHSAANRKTTHHTKQDFLRARSKYVKKAADLKTTRVFYYSHGVRANQLLSKDEVTKISHILGKSYDSIRIIEHTFFGELGSSAILMDGDLAYSEAYAGSGEFAVVKLVSEIYKAKRNSLIILDEPEVSLHPGAQKRMLEFLIERIKIDKHQVVLGTHSPFFVKGLPNHAIKVLYENLASKKIEIINSSSETEAFFQIEVDNLTEYTIYVEDRLAKIIVDRAIREFGEATFRSVNVLYMPGGASVLLTKHLPSITAMKIRNTFFVLDGDQNRNITIPPGNELKAYDLAGLSKLAKEVLGGDPNIFVDGHGGESNKTQRESILLEILDFSRNNLFYLPGMTPEEFIWKNTESLKSIELVDNGDYKAAFLELTKRELGLENFESPTPEQVLHTQQMYVSRMNKDSLETLKDFLSKKLGIL